MKSLTEIFTAEGLLEKKSGVLLNRRRIFNVREDMSESMRDMYLNFAARVAVEATGIQWPLTADSKESAVTFSIDDAAEKGAFQLSVESGLTVSASTLHELKKAAEYMTSVYPYLQGGATFDTVSDALDKSAGSRVSIKRAVIDAETYALRELTAETESSKELNIEGIPAGTIEAPTVSATYEALKKQGHLLKSGSPVIITNNLGSPTVETLLNFTMAVYIDCFEISYPAVAERETKDERSHIMIEQTSGDEGIYIQGKDTIFRGSRLNLDRLLREYAYSRHQLKDTERILREIEDILSARNDAGQIAEFRQLAEGKNFTEAEIVTENYTQLPFDPQQALKQAESKLQKSVKLRKINDEREIKRWQYSYTWEGDDFIAAIKKEVLPQVKLGDRLKITGVLSEDRDVRDSLAQEAAALIEALGAKAEVKIYRAFKSGSSWIEETVLPELRKQADIDKIKIKFRYLLNDKGQETFESESAPSYGQHLDNPDKWFDIPTRWLQELFPVDELIAQELGLSTDDIEFVRDDNSGTTYTLEAYDRTGRVTYQGSFDVKYTEKPYIDRYPQIGKVHVTTGWINVQNNGATVLNERIETDTEKIWRTLESEVLKELETYLVQKHGQDRLPAAQPLFSRLQLNLSMSEIDYDTGIREERVSTTESMQEDLYFYILDWFKTYGERECGKELDNIGLVMPEVVNSKRKDTTFSVILYDEWQERGGYRFDGQPCSTDMTPVKLELEHISLHHDTVEATVSMTGQDSDKILRRLHTLQEYIDENIIDMGVTTPYAVTVRQKSCTATLCIKPSVGQTQPISRQEKDAIVGGTIMDYSQYMKVLDYYRQYQELEIYPLDTSYKGRKIYAIEAVKRDQGVMYSEEKLRLNRITALFNARHHGNEASSQNATFRLIDKLIEDKTMSYMLDKINVVLLPCENTDGAELHHNIIKDNPKWLSHAARYNAAGFEYRKDYYNKDTKYGEAKVIKKLWDQWQFDIVTDNHGFEGHELCQPFCGYISPWYKSFWIPRALYYGYIWYKSTHPGLQAFGEKVQDAVATAINRDEEIKALNDRCAERFYKYAEKWFPDMFNTEKYKDVIFYWIDTTKKQRHCNFSVDSPEITTIDWTTEVADETATGHNLELNIRAHHISDMALMELLYDTQVEWETLASQQQDGSWKYLKVRKKPLK